MKVKVVSSGLRCPESIGTKGYWYAEGYGLPLSGFRERNLNNLIAKMWNRLAA